jgi:hypothetical protein
MNRYDGACAFGLSGQGGRDIEPGGMRVDVDDYRGCTDSAYSRGRWYRGHGRHYDFIAPTNFKRGKGEAKSIGS